MRLERTLKQMQEIVWLCDQGLTESPTVRLVLALLSAKVQYKMLLPHHEGKPYYLKLSAVEASALGESVYPEVPILLNYDLLEAIGRIHL